MKDAVPPAPADLANPETRRPHPPPPQPDYETRGQSERADGLTSQEGHVMDNLTAAVQAFAQLEQQHPQEWDEFITAIHHAQDLLACRIARRHYPDGWPTITD